MGVDLKDRPSPNHGPRRGNGPVDILLLHYTGMPTAAAALDRLCDPAAEVSAHYLIEEDGTIWRLVDEARRAWHAGESVWAGERDVNSRSIGIELANPGHGPDYRVFPDAQMDALAALGREILARHPVPSHRVLGHSDVAPGRKRDPGELFDWRLLSERGIGLWSDASVPAAECADPAALMRRFGYRDASAAAIAAFQLHFRPTNVTGIADPETLARLADLAERAGLA
ncbi:MAG TPA: N-acetylmuramoyl-L-alanine amidase [Alphaproteobacteria bacterium]|nr:N-acetylmuramoyl-L-alanine amidase [Alphaproteobacteria bacterium]